MTRRPCLSTGSIRLMPPHIVDLNDYQIPEWPTTPEGEERQAKEMEEMYRLLFDHPLVEAITGWDFADGAWLGAPSGVIRKDNSVKASYEMLRKLIHEEWHTAGSCRTDENGWTCVEGFKGSYRMTVGGASAELELGSADSADRVILR